MKKLYITPTLNKCILSTLDVIRTSNAKPLAPKEDEEWNPAGAPQRGAATATNPIKLQPNALEH